MPQELQNGHDLFLARWHTEPLNQSRLLVLLDLDFFVYVSNYL